MTSESPVPEKPAESHHKYLRFFFLIFFLAAEFKDSHTRHIMLSVCCPVPHFLHRLIQKSAKCKQCSSVNDCSETTHMCRIKENVHFLETVTTFLYADIIQCCHFIHCKIKNKLSTRHLL